MTPAEILRAARERISDPARWCKGELALDNDGEDAEPDSDDACQWCAIGAVQSVGGGDSALVWLENALPYGDDPIVAFNDAPTTTHADVLSAFDRAIALAEAQ